MEAKYLIAKRSSYHGNRFKIKSDAEQIVDGIICALLMFFVMAMAFVFAWLAYFTMWG